MVLWDYVPNKSSRNDVVNAMKVNLELKDHEDITDFSFSINKNYEKKVIGYGPYNSGGRYTLLPDFTGDTKDQAQATASKLGIKVSFEVISGTVVSQSYPANKRIDLIKDTLVLKLSKSQSDVEKEEKEKKEKEEKEKEKEKEEEKTDPTPTPTPTPTPEDDKKDDE